MGIKLQIHTCSILGRNCAMAIIYIRIGNYIHPTRFVSANYRCDFVHIISATNYGSSKQIRMHSALRMIKRVNLLATRRWSGKFVVDGVKQGTKLIDRALIITRCHGHYSQGIERPLYWTSGSLSIFSRISTIIVLYAKEQNLEQNVLNSICLKIKIICRRCMCTFF